MTREQRVDLISKLASEDLEKVDIQILREFFYKRRMEYYREFDDDELMEFTGVES